MRSKWGRYNLPRYMLYHLLSTALYPATSSATAPQHSVLRSSKKMFSKSPSSVCWFIYHGNYIDRGISWHGGTPKSSILIGFSIINRPAIGLSMAIAISGTPKNISSCAYQLSLKHHHPPNSLSFAGGLRARPTMAATTRLPRLRHRWFAQAQWM